MPDELVDPRTLIHKTGVDTGIYITIDEKKCSGCGKCMIICPVELYKVVEKNWCSSQTFFKFLFIICSI